MKFLGIHIGSHDTNYSYSNGTKVRYYKPERQRQIKHYTSNSIEQIIQDLKFIGIDLDNIDCVATHHDPDYSKPPRPQDELFYIETNSPLQSLFKCKIYQVNHHFSHTLSCWPLKDFKTTSKHFVLDGSGSEAETTTVFDQNSNILVKHRLPYNLSLGRGLKKVGKLWNVEGHKNDFAGKLMSLQSFGNLDQNLINWFTRWDKFTIEDFNSIFFDIPTETDISWLRTIHHMCEQAIVEFFQSQSFKNEYITYSGGIAQNIVINTLLRKWNNNIVIPPHCGDEGISLGLIELCRIIHNQEPFDNFGFPYWQNDIVTETPSVSTINKVTELLANGKIVGWCQGAGEIGPRALGNRSILMRPDIKGGKNIINSRVKHRESYRPFGCSVLDEEKHNYIDCDFSSPFMLYTTPLKDRNTFESISHIDKTTRPQTVSEGLFADLLYKYKEKTGFSLILNTSLNINGKPIATPESAQSFNINSGLDAICIGDSLKIF